MSLVVVDSHTAGEPTRIIVSGGPSLNSGSLAERRDRFRHDFDHLRSAVVHEPRGSDVLVGGMLCKPTDSQCVAGVFFFNNVGYLGMCGHGTIGVAVTLAHLGRIAPGEHCLETPVGLVPFTLHDENRVTLENVPSYRLQKDVAIDVSGIGRFVGDVAWGGNWFYLVHQNNERLEFSRVDDLTSVGWKIRHELQRRQITGADGAEIDHIDLFGPPMSSDNHSRNFVLCPGGAYDRSPCGTGTSAKLACLAADGKLQPGEVWRQESILGTVFEATYRWDDDQHQSIVSRITGSAFVTGEATLHLDPHDPFRYGICTDVTSR
ncbi:MAG: proline racemase family protein [Planctomycetota bacterium]|nr:proline racemase family protein [Planctomycetota bacterium]MDA1213235.1 proline racemase family protein [Planctomycetota bacterium]